MSIHLHTKAPGICVFVLLFIHVIKAQNLIPDSSFENNTAVPTDFSAIGLSNSWSMPTLGTSDLFCVCTRKTKLLASKIYSSVDVPQNPMGYQYAHSGTCYAGLFAFSHGDYREYVQTPLTAPLEKNKSYLFKMYLSLADYSRASIDQLGVCFLTAKANYNSTDAIYDLDPVYIKIENQIVRDLKSWHCVTISYKAHGGESYLVIGSFEIHTLKQTKIKAPKEIRSRINQTSERDAYYFIDDVSLVETRDDSSNEYTDNTIEPEPGLSITPGIPIIFKDVLFQTNETLLVDSSYAELDELADYLEKNPQLRIEITGHTDNSGNEKTNTELSIGRAKAIADHLSKKNIDKQRITCKGYGSTKPLVPNDTKENKQQNRRVEFILY